MDHLQKAAAKECEELTGEDSDAKESIADTTQAERTCLRTTLSHSNKTTSCDSKRKSEVSQPTDSLLPKGSAQKDNNP